jgi:hypothetical protein
LDPILRRTFPRRISLDVIQLYTVVAWISELQQPWATKTAPIREALRRAANKMQAESNKKKPAKRKGT